MPFFIYFHRAAGESIAQRLLQQRFFTDGGNLGIYIHCPQLREVDTSHVLTAALAAGQRCYVPRIEDKASNMTLLHLDGLQVGTRHWLQR